MDEGKPFDLSEFLTDCLSLQANVSTPTRMMFPSTYKDPYLNLINLDPLDVLKENNFRQQNEILEDFVGTPIQEFFRGANIFITGGTGFIGKILIQKLIRSIPHIGHIYLLIRAKRGKTSQERFEQLLKDQVFLRMRTEVPQYGSKLTAVDGDISEPGLGLSAADRQFLSDRVHVVFHSAADVKFMEPLRVAIIFNVLGSKQVLDLAKEMKNLKSYIHVSTAFSQCVRRVIEETIPKMSVSYQEVLKNIQSKTDEDLENELPRILQGWPNTYTFSKAVCEDMVYEEATGLPVCVFRPSVVVPTYREPVRGWTDNIYGPSGMFLGAGMGILHCFMMDWELNTDTVPVDYVTNAMIAAAWRTGTHRYMDVVPVYNFTSTPVRPMCWKGIVECALNYMDHWPLAEALWHTSFFTTTSHIIDELSHIFLHRIPGKIIDALAVLCGQKPRLSKIYERIQTLKSSLHYFSFKTWEYKNDNVMNMWHSLSKEDKEEFHFDVRDVDLKQHFLLSKLGVRYYYLKEKMESIPYAKWKRRWLFWAHNCLRLVSGLVVLKLLVFVANVLPM